jgi:AraC-like DNA-binding protein
VVVFQSGGQATVGEKTFEICPGECVLLFPHQFHRFENSGDRVIKWLFITFELHEGEWLSPLRDRPVVMDAKAQMLLKRLLAVRVGSGKAGCDELELVYTFSQFLRHLLKCRPIKVSRWHRGQDDDSNSLILEKVNNLVRSDLSRNPRITELAARTGYSASHLRFVFRNKLGISLGKYLRESRLAEAAKLLQRTDLQVTEIAKKSGFDSLVAFSRAFKKAYNLSPAAYSKLVRRGELPVAKRRAEW